MTDDACVTPEQRTCFDLLNAHRRAHGVAPLRLDARLQAAAVAKATAMARDDDFGHTDRDGVSAAENAYHHGYPRNAGVGENILYGQRDGAAMFGAWRGSPAHDVNMRSPHYRAVGIGGPSESSFSGEGDVYNAGAMVLGTVAGPEPGACGRPAARTADRAAPGDPTPEPPVRPRRLERLEREARREGRAG